jgi:hypothetical protein
MKFLTPMANLVKMIGFFIVSGVLVNPNNEEICKRIEEIDNSIENFRKIKIKSLE